jgi:hypothetical protein
MTTLLPYQIERTVPHGAREISRHVVVDIYDLALLPESDKNLLDDIFCEIAPAQQCKRHSAEFGAMSLHEYL